MKDGQKDFENRLKKKKQKILEQKKRVELKKLRRRLKKAKGVEKRLIEEKLERMETRQKKIEEETFDAIVNTIKNKQRTQEREKKERDEKEKMRQELVQKGLIEDKIHMNSKKYRMDAPELQNFHIGRLIC